MRVLCAIPALDEEVAIGSVVLRARNHVDTVVVVDDGSTDGTAAVAELAGAVVLRHATNQGKGEAYRTFWEYARREGYDRLVTLDGDGQHDPDEIPLLLAQLDQGADLVVGARWGSTTEMPIWRRFGKRILDYGTAAASGPGAGAATVQGLRLTDSQSGYRAYSRRALESISPHEAGFSVESQILIDAHQANLRIAETRIHCRYDVEGSTLGPVRHASGVLADLLFEVGVAHPLLYIGLPGLLFMLGGIAAGVWTSYIATTTNQFPIAWLFTGLVLVAGGGMAVFAGLLLTLLPRSISHSLRRLPKG